jgi:Domain of unknown function (DUF4129)
MMKFFSWLLLLFFLAGGKTLFAQTATDSLQAADTVQSADSVTVGTAREDVQVNTDTLSAPVADSGYLPGRLCYVPQRQVKSYLENPNYAYANDPAYWAKQPPENPGVLRGLLNSKIFQWLIFTGIICLVLFGIYQLARENNFSWLMRKGKKNNSEAAEQVQDEEIDYDTAILKYQEEGNYRLAIRYMYLRLIRTVREKTSIPIRDSSTNAEIARALNQHPQAREFRFLTMAYEYIFYGGFSPEQELFDSLKNKFDAFQKIQPL